MRDNKELYFSPKVKFKEIDWDDEENVLDAFFDRVNGFYIKPIELLTKSKNFSFAAGALSIIAIDFLSEYIFHKEDSLKRWLKKYIPKFDEVDPNPKYKRKLADRFDEEFRNKLIHEGRIKNSGMFDIEINKAIEMDMYSMNRTVMIVNPEITVAQLKDSLKEFIEILRNDTDKYFKFKGLLKKKFKEDIFIATLKAKN